MSISSKTGEKMVRVLYVDIDDTIRKGFDSLGRFVNTAADVEVFDGVADLLWEYKKLGWRIIGVSNQGGIALGHMTMQDCVLAMAETQRQTRMAFDKLMWCSHHPDAEDPEMAVCWCRKPKAGLVIEGALTLREKTLEMYPPHLGVFVGDRPEDQECAANAGLFFVDAVEWRSGKHLEVAKESAEIIRQQEKLMRSTEAGIMSIDEAREALGLAGVPMVADNLSNLIKAIESTDEGLPAETLALSLELTGVQVRKVPVCEVELGAEIVYDGRLFMLTTKNDTTIIARESGENFNEVFFFNPDAVSPSDVSTPWTVEVITDAETTETHVEEREVKDLEPGDSFLYNGTLYMVDVKDDTAVTANCPGRPGVSFWDPNKLYSSKGYEPNTPTWDEKVLTTVKASGDAIPVSDLEVGDEFEYSERVFVIQTKTKIEITAYMKDDEHNSITFQDPRNSKENDGIPTWSVRVKKV